MTPKEKSKKLVDRFRLLVLRREYNVSERLIIELAKQCALICVDEIINIGSNPNNPTGLYYWQEVKQEINKL